MWNFCWCGPENPDVEHSRDSNPHPYTHAPQPLAWTSVRTFAPTVRRAASLPAWYMKCNKFRYLCIIYVVIWYFSPKQKNEKRRAMAGRTSTSTSTSRTMARSRARSRTSQLGQPWHRVNITHFHWLCVGVCVWRRINYTCSLCRRTCDVCKIYILNEIFRHVHAVVKRC